MLFPNPLLEFPQAVVVVLFDTPRAVLQQPLTLRLFGTQQGGLNIPQGVVEVEGNHA
jgi:hypothetical protein